MPSITPFGTFVRTYHPAHTHLVLLSKISKGMPHITHPQHIEKCVDCLITKIRNAARGSDPAFEAPHTGQGLTLDMGFMFQRSKNKKRMELITGITGSNAYCIVYDLYTELMFGITLKGKTLPLAWVNLLLIQI
jgi:hypothetical protein